MPLSLAYVSRSRTMFYASEDWMFDAALDSLDWRALELDPMTLAAFHVDTLLDFTREGMTFSPSRTLDSLDKDR